MKKLSRILVAVFVALDAFLLVKILTGGKNLQVLNPAGLIAYQERSLIFLCVGLMLLGIIPVFIFAFYVGSRYHANNKKADYQPDWNHHTGLQIFYWGFLTTIMFILSGVVWFAAHQLDPRVPIDPGKKPLVIQVFSLRWKWLFVYPQLGIASTDFVEFPEKTPITFEITASDTPMTSFWIPQLGGQIYAMSGMATQTHLMADGIGQYRGASSEINGEGYADMVFTAKSVTDSDFEKWVTEVKQSPDKLTYKSFKKLDQPEINRQIRYYSSTPDNLFTTIVMQYMAKPSNSLEQHATTHDEMQGMSGM
jgi:cytochrome o ubiquinol oxidase subunit 2